MPQDNKGKAPNPEAQRANVKNPNNPEKKAADDNRANQMNPEHPAYLPQQPAPKQ